MLGADLADGKLFIGRVCSWQEYCYADGGKLGVGLLVGGVWRGPGSGGFNPWMVYIQL